MSVRGLKTTAAEEVRPGLLPRLLGYHLRRAQVALFKHFHRTVGAEEGITPGLFGTLVLIGEHPGLAQSRLAEAMEVDRSTIVTVIDRLESMGLVVRGRSTTDRRSHALRLTPAGQRKLRRLEALVREHERAFAAALTLDEQAVLKRLLERLHAP